MQRLILLIVLAAGAWFGWRWMFPDDETQMRSVLTRIADAVEGQEGEPASGSGGLDGIARVAALQNEFTVDAVVDAGPPFQQLRGRQAIVATAARTRATVRGLELRFLDVDVTIAEDRHAATARLTAEARFDEPGGGRGMDARELEVSFVRQEGRWMIGRVVSVAAFQSSRVGTLAPWNFGTLKR